MVFLGLLALCRKGFEQEASFVREAVLLQATGGEFRDGAFDELPGEERIKNGFAEVFPILDPNAFLKFDSG
ncbi:MAG: hypothetical protein PHF70_10995 [Opitutales bacterium]|nr:hypothetical protein [Opitutales bacterium]